MHCSMFGLLIAKGREGKGGEGIVRAIQSDPN